MANNNKDLVFIPSNQPPADKDTNSIIVKSLSESKIIIKERLCPHDLFNAFTADIIRESVIFTR